MYELLVSGDAFVPDHAAAVHQAAAELGIRPLDVSKSVKKPSQRIEYSFSRIHRDRRLAPTMLEFLAVLDTSPDWKPTEEYDGIPELAASQGTRPARLHSTVVAVDDVWAVAERLARLGVTHRLAEPSENFPFPRLWVGHQAGRHGVHDPGADGGTWLEFVPMAVLDFPEPGPVSDVEVAEGSAVRIVARTILVSDLADTIARLDKHFGWEPAAGPARSPDGVLRAHWLPSYPNSAVLELIQADSGAEGYEADFMAAHGRGPCSIRFAVRGLDALRDRLRSRGVDCVDAVELDGSGPRFIRPAEYALGTAFEFVEWDGS